MKINPISLERMKYKTNKTSYALALLGLVLNIFYFITLYKNNNEFFSAYMMGISILYNLIFMLLVFYSAEEIKTYRLSFSALLIVIGGIQVFRVFFYPLQALKAEAILPKTYNFISIYLIISAIFLFLSGIISIIKILLLRSYLKHSKE